MGGMSAMFRPGGDYYAFEELDPSILKLLKEITDSKANTEVLDVGCGRGLLREALAKMGCRVTGIESHPDAVAECKDRLDGIIDHDPTDMVLFIEHLGGQVRDFVGDGGRWALKVTYSDEGDTLQGKGGGRELLMTLFKNDNQWDAINDVLEDGRVALYEKNILAGECVTYIDFGLSVPTKKRLWRGCPAAGRAISASCFSC